MKKRVIITGATGFIGRHLSHFLQGHQLEVHVITRKSVSENLGQQHVCELTDEKGLARIFAAVRPHYLIHLAACAQPGRDPKNIEPQVENTLKPAISIARTAPASLELALFFGTSDEYGGGDAPFREDSPLHPVSPYGWAKTAAFHGVRLLCGERNVPWCWVRPFLVFGPGQDRDRLLPSLIESCMADRKVDLTPGEQTRDLIYIYDLCKMVTRILDHASRAKGQVVNLCSGRPRTVRAIAETVQRLAGAGKLNFGGIPYRSNEAMSFYGSTEKFENLFGKIELVDFERALEITIGHYAVTESKKAA